jgi:hypothetical protein
VKRRRGITDGGPADQLVHYREADWISPKELDPYPAGVDDPPEIRWERARRAWSREARSLAELNALWPRDLVSPPMPDPRVERDLMVALLHPQLRDQRKPR